MTPRIFFFIALFSLILTGCAFGGGTRSLDELKQDPGSADAYRVKSGDILNVEVWGEPRVSGQVTVRQDGKFNMPLVKDIFVDDKTLEEATALVTKALNEFIPNASVNVTVVHTAPIRYYLSGSFMKAGEYLSDSRVTFLQAIAKGSGFAPFADVSSVLLIRKKPEGEVRYRLDYNRVIDGREPNPELKNGDILAVK